MHTPLDQTTTDVNERIHNFMDRKTSPLRNLSQSIAEVFAPSAQVGTTSREDISYEQIKWHATPDHS